MKAALRHGLLLGQVISVSEAWWMMFTNHWGRATPLLLIAILLHRYEVDARDD